MPSPAGTIARKNANVLVPDAQPSELVFLAERIWGPFGLRRILERFRGRQGGLWVGGTVYLTSDHLSFEPNRLNVKAHTTDQLRSVALQSIHRIEERFGYVTRIINLELKDGSTFTLRCFGARAFAHKIQAAVDRAQRR